MLSPVGSNFQHTSSDKTPSPTSANVQSQSVISPAGSSMSLAAVVSPPTNSTGRSAADPRLSYVEGDQSSCRESVDSRINQGFNDMRIGNSAYAAHNQSSTSIQNTLNTQRNPRPGFENLPVHRISNGYQPNTERNPEATPKAIRTAPAITGPATSTIARAAEPTKGQAWAFPEDDLPRIGGANGGAFMDSRRSSIADSLASSQFTSESRLPPGQRRLDEAGDYGHRLSSTSSEFPPVHHHTLQQSQTTEESKPQTGSQPYSRTPESRQSHKLAERKRRTEMKELFDQLRDLMPQERGSKASKWEILTKG